MENAAIIDTDAHPLILTAEMRRGIARMAEGSHGVNKRLLEFASRMLIGIWKHFRMDSEEPESFEFEVCMHDLWYVYYHVVKSTPPESTMMDRFVFQIIEARDRGLSFFLFIFSLLFFLSSFFSE